MLCALPGAVAYFVRDGELHSPNPLCATGHGTSASGCPVPCGLNIPHRKEAIPIDFCHIPVSIIKRSEGRSAVAAAAYRSGTKLTNEWDGQTHDYTRKGGVVHAEIMLPAHAPPEFADRSTLWNSVEQIEKARDSQLAREIEAALPRELTREQQLALVRAYVKDNFVDKGMCADFAIHDKGTGNPHVHIMLTVRPLKENGAWGAKCRKAYDLDENGQRIPDGKGGWKNHREDTTDWNDKGNVEIWRAAWAAYTNRALEAAGHPALVDHRSYERQGIDKIPSVHLGPAASQMSGTTTQSGSMTTQTTGTAQSGTTTQSGGMTTQTTQATGTTQSGGTTTQTTQATGTSQSTGMAQTTQPTCMTGQTAPDTTLPCTEDEQWIVQKGQTVSDLQLRGLVSRHTLETANPGVDLENLSVGQTVCIPKDNVPCALPETYTLAATETLEAVAMRFNLPVASLLRANPCLAPQDFEGGVTVILPK